MTDLQKYLKMLNEFGVAFVVSDEGESITVIFEAKTNGVRGYSGFSCEAEFCKDTGKFITFAIYE